MHVSAVKVSFTAGDSARMAISTSWSIANGEVLGERAVGAGDVGPVEARGRRRPAASGGQTRASGRPSTHEVARSVEQPDHAVGSRRDVDQRARSR